MNDKDKQLTEIMEYKIFDKEIEDKMNKYPEVTSEVKSWITNSVGKSHLNSIKRCYVKYIDYENSDYEVMDEFQRKEFLRVCKKNSLQCPSHKNCPMFQNNLLKEGMKCPLELAESETQLMLLAKELDIKPEETNDQILLSQLVGLNMLYQRGMLGLSNEALIVEIKKINKDGSVTYDTKVNENYTIVKNSLSAMEALRKSLILNRADKQKIKQIKESKTLEDVKENTIQMIKNQENNFDVQSIVAEVIDDTESNANNNKNNDNIIKDIDA